ncbi:cupin [Sphingomonas baiyangensis]|uniref:Cupin n=1 Tax=Sphingomonas baiyangensis TaxID=2572576 RepID=A0A4U1L4R1_9SPHN|nr:cupin [Sphingomonas baiyangensis]TKD51889.1 cupin [Sphingomonas baiyangensis]
MTEVPSLFAQFVHLGLGATAEAQPAFDGMAWYEGYAARTANDGAEGRLVSLYRFDANWTMWEMHPAGEELVVCVGGAMTLHQEHADGTVATLRLGMGDYAINPRGVWHTADVEEEATALFVTAGAGTEHRAR